VCRFHHKEPNQLIYDQFAGDPSCYFCNENETIDHLFFFPVPRLEIFGPLLLNALVQITFLEICHNVGAGVKIGYLDDVTIIFGVWMRSVGLLQWQNETDSPFELAQQKTDSTARGCDPSMREKMDRFNMLSRLLLNIK
jgi:hypothetical protein